MSSHHTSTLALTNIWTGEVEFLDVFQEAYAAVMRYTRAPDGFWVSPPCAFLPIHPDLDLVS